MHRYILKDNLKVYNVPLKENQLAILGNVQVYTTRQFNVVKCSIEGEPVGYTRLCTGIYYKTI